MHFRFLTLLFCLCTFVPAVYAQEEDPPIEAPNGLLPDRDGLFDRDGTTYTSYLFDAGYTNLRPWQLNQSLFGNTAGFYRFTTLGVAENNVEDGIEDGYHPGSDVSLALHWLLAQEIKTMRASDSVQMSYRLRGWELMTSLFAADWIPNEHVDFVTGIGTFWGNLKLQSENITANTGRQLYKNPFVAPMLRAELRFNVWALSFGGRWSYRHDITRDNWKRTDDNMEQLSGYKFREMQFMVYIGLRIVD